uniref:Uncharacterized protein n=1 Tax=Chromera velia CCMP2878 TaxID=1169474 RepID=A0A0G4H8L2_9ALVE|eukprot:Cvel_25203.t1-p1 / transcript=Cvel_25203.t1 / gene=Cvel_25203 / organism=Chromera_velia_CCMP2878 / gene_product=hypothetical protein / transcript_product=hypothetical protein / location=Cvel_scaffold2823:21695-21895(+) / protein_length=67 / sequence_SO=supercontig / SO=protein_coding / is_pseudo=false
MRAGSLSAKAAVIGWYEGEFVETAGEHRSFGRFFNELDFGTDPEETFAEDSFTMFKDCKDPDAALRR